jgi:hypothetical protein
MLETIGRFLGNVASYIVALLALVALYYLWVAFREWRAGARAAFGIERDIATSEMVGAVVRAGGVVILGLVVLGLGQLGERAGESSAGTPQQTRLPTPLPTTSVFETLTPQSGEPLVTQAATDTLLPELTDVPSLPGVSSETPAIQPTPQTASVTAFGGVWLRDAPNGGTIEVLPQESIVQFLDGREFAGSFEWQKVRVLNVPAGSEALVGQEGWVASEFLELSP